MSRRTNFGLAVLAAAALAAGAAQATPTTPHDQACFRSSDWQGWSAPGDSNVIYLRVRMHDIFRVELTPGTHVHKDPGYFLVSKIRGSTWISPCRTTTAIASR